jgi:hypothetical protein
MGMGRIHGKAARENTGSSPISHTACFFCQVHIEKWKDEEDSGRWLHYGAESGGVEFYLEDDSGRVLVDPRGADCDLESNVVRDVSSTRSSVVTPSGASDSELLAYVARVGPGAELPGSRRNPELERAMLATYKFTRKPTTPDELFQGLVGPQVGRLRQSFVDEGPHSDPLREELRLAQIDLYTHPFWSPEYDAGRKHVIELQDQVRKAGPSIELTPPSLPSSPVASEPRTAEEIVASIEGTVTAKGRYQLTERCILQDHEYDITGTCVENPEPKDVNDGNMIRRGKNEPAFLISGLARPDVDAMQKIRAQFMIFGGAMLAVFSLSLLLLQFGQF